MKKLALACTTALAICLFAALRAPVMAQSPLPSFGMDAQTSIAITIVMTDGQTIVVPVDLHVTMQSAEAGVYLDLSATTTQQPGMTVMVVESGVITAEVRAAAQPTPTPIAAQPAPTAVPTAFVAPTAPPTNTVATDQVPGLNTDVMVGDIKWRVMSVENLGNRLTIDNQFIDDAVTSGRFVRVRVEIDNRGTSGAPYWVPSIIDDRGREYNDYSGQYSFIDDADQCLLLTLNPGLSKQCVHIYEVAGDSQGLQLKVSDFALFFAEEALIALD